MSPVRYELGFYIPEDAILRSHCRENLKSYISHSWFQRVWSSSVIVGHVVGSYGHGNEPSVSI
jgi:hypothetical protein